MVECPGCKVYLEADDDQIQGKVSMDCPLCEYHETHNMTAEVEAKK